MTNKMEVDSDTSPIVDSREKVISKEKTQTNYINVAGIKIETNKSHPISTDLNMSGQDRHNQPRTTTTKIAAGGINLDVNSTKIGNTKKVHSVFNIKGASIQNACIGNTGPVMFESQEKKYEAGAVDNSVNIDGGHFHKANIGPYFNSKESNINKGDSRNGNDDLSAETLVKNLLETNISAEDLIALIDAKFTIQQMSVSLPALCPPANISRLAKALISCSQNV